MAVAVAVVAVTVILIKTGRREADIVVTPTPQTTAAPTTAVIPQPEPTLAPPDLGRAPIPEPGPAVGLKVANGQPGKPAIEFTSSIPIPDDLVFVLVVGSDARPREDMLRSRADSIHLVAVNPASSEGTVVGFPRDSYVQFPNGRRGKINDALTRGGPQYLAQTVRGLTGLPIDYVVTTGFVGFQKMVDELGGVDVYVERRMNDRMSTARFQPGWHHFNGGEALAFSRNRNDVPYGDFSRSENQGKLLLATLTKLRSEVANDDDLLGWVAVLNRLAKVDVPADHLPRLAALARRMAPERMNNVVLPGRVGTAGGASVVFLTQDAPKLFEDLRADAVMGAASPLITTTTTSTTDRTERSTSTTEASTTTTDAPATSVDVLDSQD